MSTRATYTMNCLTYYVHCDGYPEGAAEKIAAALKRKDGDLATRFRVANPDAELSSMNRHEDTVYHYEILDDQIQVYRWNFRNTRWTIAYSGNLQAWLNRQLKQAA